MDSEDLDTHDWEAPLSVPTWGDMALLQAAQRPDTEMLVFPHTRLTYGQFAQAALRRARSLMATGIRPGDHVGLLLPSSSAYVELLFATAMVGAVAVVVNSRYRSHELAYVVENADLDLLIVAGEVADDLNYAWRLRQAFPELDNVADPRALQLADAPRLRRVVVLDAPGPGFVGIDEFEAGAAHVAEVEVHRRRHGIRLRDPFLMMYTSGTTAMPKGCLLSHEAVVRAALLVSRRFGLQPSDRYWTPLPLFHFGALQPLAASVLAGSTFICMPQFEAGAALAMLEAERATVAFLAFPAIINDLIGHPDLATRDVSRLTRMMSSAAVQPEAVQAALRDAFPGVVQLGMYGMTENAAAGTCTGAGDGFEAGYRAVGRPLPGMDLRVMRGDGSPAAVDEVGEIHFRGFGLMETYYRADEVAQAAYSGEWFRSGDLGSFNEHGELMFRGRSKDMLKIGGENVAAAEVEAFIHRHPAVKLCQVVGVPDPRLAEVAAAFVEIRPGHTVSEREVIAFCDGSIASFKVPRYVRFVSEWPLTATSKVQKRLLAERITAELSDAQTTDREGRDGRTG